MHNAISVRNAQCHKHTTMAEEEDRVRPLATLRKRKQARNIDRHHCTVEEYSESERKSKSIEASRLGDKAVTTLALCTAQSKLERSATSRFILVLYYEASSN